MNKTIYTKNAPKPIGPYSQAVIKDNIIYTSGQICINPKTNKLNNKNINVEAQQVFRNIKYILNKVGSSFDKIIKINIYIKDLNNFNIINDLFNTYFNEPYPARSTIEVSNLPLNVNLEIDVIASI